MGGKVLQRLGIPGPFVGLGPAFPGQLEWVTEEGSTHCRMEGVRLSSGALHAM